MKTFATLALLGLTSAIKMDSNEEKRYAFIIRALRDKLFEECDANGNGICTDYEQE